MPAPSARLTLLLALLGAAAGASAAPAAPPAPDEAAVQVDLIAGRQMLTRGQHIVMRASRPAGPELRRLVPPEELHVTAAHGPDGPFTPLAVRADGDTFVFAPRAAGVYFVRIGRRAGGARPAQLVFVVTDEQRPQARSVRVLLRLPRAAGWPPGAGGIGLRYLPQAAAPAQLASWRLPMAFVPRGLPVRIARLPRGRYEVGAADERREDDPDLPPAPAPALRQRFGPAFGRVTVERDGVVRLPAPPAPASQP